MTEESTVEKKKGTDVNLVQVRVQFSKRSLCQKNRNRPIDLKVVKNGEFNVKPLK